MNIEVRYLSKSGNTKKLAEAIAQEVGVKAKGITEKVTANTDILFLGGAVYAAGIDNELKEFIKGLDGRIKKVAVFSTAAIKASAYPQMKKYLVAKNLNVLEDEFHCRGKFLKIHSARPNEKDLVEAKAFAKRVIK
jgi:flavodoxin